MKQDGSGRRWTRIFRPDARAEVEDELAFHFEQRVRENIARGMDPETARVAAQQRFGDLKSIQAECTDLLIAERNLEKRREWLRFSWLDFKLGFRMLAKYPGMTIVGGLAIAFAIMVGASAFEFWVKVAHPSLGLPDSERVVAIWLWETRQSNTERRALHDFDTWRTEAKSFEVLSAYRDSERNIVGADGRAIPVKIAVMTAAGFRVAGEAPLKGRVLSEEDERVGAPLVIVLSEKVWRNRFESDPDIVGRVVRVGGYHHTVAGVMPAGYAFPMDHEAWIPLRQNVAYQPVEGPAVRMAGRLRPGVTLEQARTELTALVDRVAVASPQTHRFLQPRVEPYHYAFLEQERDALVGAYFVNGFMALFMLLIYANVALLMFGRAATRESEIVVRNALGASRTRILTQLFTEALVLGCFAALVGLLVVRLGIRGAVMFVEGNNVELPFWFRESISPLTIVYVVGLTLVAALIAGVFPGIKATRGLGNQLRAGSAGGGGLRFGGIWTVIIVTQVAFTVAFFPALLAMGLSVFKARNIELGFPAEHYLAVRLDREEGGIFRPNESGAVVFAGRPDDPRSISAIYEELQRRVEAEPGVRAAAYTLQFPGQFHPEAAIEILGAAPTNAAGAQLAVQRATVGTDFFDATGATLVSGRPFHPADPASSAGVVIVNESFARSHLGGRNPVGRQLRYLNYTSEGELKPSEWYEVVGVVKDLAMGVDHLVGGLNFRNQVQDQPGVYHPLSLDNPDAMSMIVQVDGDPRTFGPRLQTIATAVDPTLKLSGIQSLDQVARGYVEAVSFWFRIMIGAGVVALVLSLAGIYSIMSYTVARRTREIGIRVALGSTRARILSAMFTRPLVQISIGVLAGALLFFWVVLRNADVDVSLAQWASQIAMLATYAALMTGVCLLACVVPAQRALRVEPTDALRADG